MTDGSHDWTAEEIEELFEPVRVPARRVLALHGISGERAKEILGNAMVTTIQTTTSPDEARVLFLDAVEWACREERASLGPPEEDSSDSLEAPTSLDPPDDEETEPYVH